MGKTFVEDERPCDLCVNVTRYGCVSWNCEYINRDEAIKAWREKHEMADRKTENSSEKPNNCEPQTIRCPKCGRTDYIRDMEKDMGIKGSHYKYKCINCNTYIKDEPQTETKTETQNSNLTFEKRTMRDCYNCKRYETEGECIECHYEPKDEPQTDCAWRRNE